MAKMADVGRLLDSDNIIKEEVSTIKPESHTTKKRKKPGRRARPIFFLVLAFISIILLLMSAFGIGILLGWSVYHSEEEKSQWGRSVNINGEEQSTGDWMSDNINASNIKENLRHLTIKPHIAGKQQNVKLAKDLYNQWSGYNFDRVEMYNYSVLLSYVNRSNFNVLKVQDTNGRDLFIANTTREKPLVKQEFDTDVPPPFNGYSGVGQAKGPLVYVNYGKIEDFLYLTQNLSLDIKGYICIVRYGQIFRGDKAHLAQRFGCAGLIIYSDPVDYAPKGGPPVFPNGPSLPPSGLQRGSLMITNGDPLTPGLPSLDEIYRRPYEEAQANGDVPSIPVQPISYGDAFHFMSQLSEHSVPDGWEGELNITYKILQSSDNTNVTFIEVNNVQNISTINNVIAVIYGTIEPDHMVILGNHRDAWTFGAVDPNSGTAVLMEIARLLSDLRDKGWRPGRTLVLCSWDAEEFSLIGSTEWVEDIQQLLGANALVYLNIDVAVSGMSHITVVSSPLLFEIIYNVTQQVDCPGDCKGSVYDQWKSFYPSSTRPRINNLGSGTDYVAFIQRLGVTSMDFTYAGKNSYPVYHSVHDNFYWASTFGDPDFTHHKAMGEMWSRIGMEIATTPILPYNPTDYTQRLREMYDDLKEMYGDSLKRHDISLDFLNDALDEFSKAAIDFSSTLKIYIDTNNENIIRILNNKLMNIERAFIIPEGLPGRPYYKHVIFAPSSVNMYASASFPGVVDAIFNASSPQEWNEVHRQLDIVAVHVRYATQIMNQPSVEWIK